jgi:predicted Zn finger-like uncharacterized protein
MIVTCPACVAQYVLPDESIGEKGRRVKCTSCGYTWLQSRENDIVAEKPIFSVPEYNDTKPAREFKAPRQRMTPVVSEKSALPAMLAIGFGLAIILVLITVGASAIFRPLLVAEIPATALLFDKIGLPIRPPGMGLAFTDVKTQIDKTPGRKDLLSVNGKLVNDTKQDIPLTRLVIRLNSESGWLKDWPISLYGHSLGAGKSTNFNYDLKDFPENGQSVTLLFAD